MADLGLALEELRGQPLEMFAREGVKLPQWAPRTVDRVCCWGYRGAGPPAWLKRISHRLDGFFRSL